METSTSKIKVIKIEYMSCKDSEWRLKKAIELLMGNNTDSIQKSTKDNLKFEKRITDG